MMIPALLALVLTVTNPTDDGAYTLRVEGDLRGKWIATTATSEFSRAVEVR